MAAEGASGALLILFQPALAQQAAALTGVITGLAVAAFRARQATHLDPGRRQLAEQLPSPLIEVGADLGH